MYAQCIIHKKKTTNKKILIRTTIFNEKSFQTLRNVFRRLCRKMFSIRVKMRKTRQSERSQVESESVIDRLY